MSKFLHYVNGQLVALSLKDVAERFSKVEEACRTGLFTYVDTVIFQEQIDEIKTAWPDNAKAFVKAEAKKIANGAPITPEIIKQAVMTTCRNLVAVERGRRNMTDPKAEFLYMSGDMALSHLVKKAPDASVEALPRKIGGKTVKVKASSNPKRLVIDEEKANDVDIVIQSIFIKNLEKSILLGYATKEDLAAAPKDNKTTNEKCNWTKMAHHLALENLRPMSDFMKMFSLNNLPKGVVFESVPKLVDLPILGGEDMQQMLKVSPKPKAQTYDEFLADCGFDTAPATPAPKGLEL